MTRRILRLTIYGLFCTTILAGCRTPETQKPPPEPTQTQSGQILLPQTTPFPTSMVVPAYPELTIPGEMAYPGPDEVFETAYPLPLSPTQAAYPAPTQEVYPAPTQVLSAYPDPNDQSLAGYPGPTDASLAAYPNPTEPGAAYPVPTQLNDPVNAATATLTLSAPIGTATPTSSPVPTNTSLPTPTPAPTASPTTELPPPVRTELAASDPELFQIGSGDVQLVEFFAFWCLTCRSMAPTIHSLEALYADQMNFIYLNIDDPANSKHKQALDYRYQPHFFLLDQEGKILRQWVGRMSTEDLRNAIDAALR